MAEVFDPIIVKVVTDLKDSVNNATGSSGRGGSGGLGVAGIAGAIGGIAAVVGELVGIVKEAVSGVLKPVKVLLTGILKLVAQLLRPIVDVVTIMLMPILIMLRPLIKVVNEIMRPFRVLAYNLMREAGKTDDPAKKVGLGQLALTTLIAGIGNVLVGLQAEIIKVVAGVVIDIVSYTGLISRERADQFKGVISGVIDGVTSSIQSATLGGLLQLSGSIMGKGEEEINKTKLLVESVIGAASVDVGNKIKDMKFYEELTGLSFNITAKESLFKRTTTTLKDTITSGFDDVTGALTSSISSLIRKARDAAKDRGGSDRGVNVGNIIAAATGPIGMIGYATYNRIRDKSQGVTDR